MNCLKKVSLNRIPKRKETIKYRLDHPIKPLRFLTSEGALPLKKSYRAYLIKSKSERIRKIPLRNLYLKVKDPLRIQR